MRYASYFFWIALIVLVTPTAAEAFFNLNIAGLGGCGASGIQSGCSGNNGLFAAIACKVMKMIDKAIIPIYCQIIYNPAYSFAVDAAMALFVIITGISYTFGLTKATIGDVILRIIKVSLIYALVSNSGLFFSFIYSNVVQTPQIMVSSILSSTGSDSTNFFQHLDEGMRRIFTESFGTKLPQAEREEQMMSTMKVLSIGIMFSEMAPGGTALAGIFIFVFGMWIVSYLFIALRYLQCYLGLIFMLMLAPIFLPMMMFRRLKELWQEWIRFVVVWIIELVLVVSFLLVIESFYTDFYDLLRKAFDGPQIQKEQITYVKPYRTEGTTIVHDEYYQRSTKNLEAFSQSLGYGDNTDTIVETWTQIITMGLVVFLALNFLNYVSNLATSLAANNYNMLRMFGTQEGTFTRGGAGKHATTFGSGSRGVGSKPKPAAPDAAAPQLESGDLRESGGN